MVVEVAEVEVRSGPSKEFLPTLKLRRGDRVKVVQESTQQPGWIAIEPPAGSFSWINSKSVLRQTTTQIAAVIGDAPVAVRPGSSLSAKAPAVETVKVKPGTLVIVLDKEMVDDTGTWLPIQPAPKEVRYIPADAVKPAPTVAAAPPGTLPGALTFKALIDQGDQALAARQIDQAKALYQQAALRAGNDQERLFAGNRLASLGVSVAGHPQWTGGVPGTPAARSTGPTPAAPAPLSGALTSAPQWSEWGQLRQTAIQKDGQPMFVLENKKGKGVLYVVTAPGFSLRDYLNRTICLYGIINYQTDAYVRQPYMTATHVATLP
jgi:uncharacterized protein YgiM (DUF1202 family)